MVIAAPRPTPRPIRLSELFPDVDSEVTVTGVAMDSRTVQPGDLYIAVGGANVHGARFAAGVVAAAARSVAPPKRAGNRQRGLVI